jgi:hypothetical protein
MIPISQPAGYVTSTALAFDKGDGTATVVKATSPLPMTGAVSVTLPSTTPLVGTSSISTTVGPYTALIGRSVMLTLTGTWSGSVQLLRSTDAGVTKIPVTMGGGSWALYTGNCCEPVWDEGDVTALLYLQMTITSGAITYRVAQ